MQTGLANSADPDQTAPDLGLHCLLFHLHLLEAFLCCKANLLEFQDDYSNILGVRKFRIFTERACAVQAELITDVLYDRNHSTCKEGKP